MEEEDAQTDKVTIGLEDLIDRDWEKRVRSFEAVKEKLRKGWRNDPDVLNQYFQSCVANWKIYTGHRDNESVIRIQGIYKQATYGDNTSPTPSDLTTTEGLKWLAWSRLQGTPKDVAKRRFITFLAQIDPLLIDVMPDEGQPKGFPLDRQGRKICAKCNTVVGCGRELLDDKKISLQRQLFENEELHTPDQLRRWIQKTLENHRCVWGMHKPITAHEAKPFTAWFNRDENQGFFPYDSLGLMALVRDLIKHHCEVAYDMQQDPDQYNSDQYNHQAQLAGKLKAIYSEFSGQTYVFELPCTRMDDPLCNERRASEGGKNHSHPVNIDPVGHDFSSNTYEEAIELRKQCQKLGISPSTGLVKGVKERCDIYRERIAQHYESLKKANESKLRNDTRVQVHQQEKARIRTLSKDMLARQLWDACQAGDAARATSLVKHGCKPDEESPRGLTPLLCHIVSDAPAEILEQLFLLKVNINYVNKHGLTPLMMACRLRDTRLIHILMKNGASTSQKSGRLFGDLTALHVCALQGFEEGARIMFDYVKEGGGDILRTARFLDAVNLNGETPLMLAALRRNGMMCRCLLSLGANPNVRNHDSRVASYLARTAGWSEVADLLEKKIGTGVSKVATFSDMQLEKKLQYGASKAREMIQNFGKSFLRLTQGRANNTCPLGPPSRAARAVFERKKLAIESQIEFQDNHQLFILGKDENNAPFSPTEASDLEELSILAESVSGLLDMMRKGMVDPNIESEGEKPLPWTPLMCAAALNDVRTCKLMALEGAEINYRNRTGTTVLMIASQLNNLQAMAELIGMGADLDLLDNEGFSSLAYASSLPPPTNRRISSVGFITEGDTEGPKGMTAQSLLKQVKSSGLGTGSSEQLKLSIAVDEEQTNPEAVDKHFRFLSLLEKNGLSHVEQTSHLNRLLSTIEWRGLKGEVLPLLKAQETFSETSSEQRERETYELIVERREAEREAKRLDELANPRCPVCTCPIPCPHFFKVESLLRFLKKDEDLKKSAYNDPSLRRSKKIHQKDRAKELLEETQLNNRHTDRSLPLRALRPREDEVSNEMEERLLRIEDEQTHHVETNKEAIVLPSPIQVTVSIPSPPLVPLPPIITHRHKPLKSALKSSSSDDFRSSRSVNFNLTLNTVAISNSETGELVPLTTNFSLPSHSLSPIKGSESHILQQVPSHSEETSASSSTHSEDTNAADRALHALQAGVGKEVHSESNPLPQSRRRVFMFTSDPMGRGGRQDVPPSSPITSEKIKTNFQPSTQTKKKLKSVNTFPPLSPSSSQSGSGKEKYISNYQNHNNLFPKPVFQTTVPPSIPPIQLSGWIFASPSSLDSGCSPVPSMRLSPSAWGLILDHMHSSYPSQYLSRMRLGSSVCPSTRRYLTPRCSVCCVGFVRFESRIKEHRMQISHSRSALDPTDDQVTEGPSPKGAAAHLYSLSDPALARSEEGLCLGCLVRKDLYWKVQTALTPGERKRLGLPEPWTESQKQKHLLRTRKSTEQEEASDPDRTHSDLLSLDPCLWTGLPRWPFRRREGGDTFLDSRMKEFQQRMESELYSSNTPSNASRSDLLFHHLDVIHRSPIASIKMLSEDAEELEADLLRRRKEREAEKERKRLLNDHPSPTSAPSPLRFQIEEQLRLLRQRAGEEGSLFGSSDSGSLTDSDSLSLETEDPPPAPRPQTQSASDPSFSQANEQLALLPFLISKGHFEEAERCVRVCLSLPSVDEGEGVVFLIRLFHIQSEMYKMMGVWLLALSLSLDAADFACSMLGFDHPLSLSSLSIVAMCLRKMGLGREGEEFIEKTAQGAGHAHLPGGPSENKRLAHLIRHTDSRLSGPHFHFLSTLTSFINTSLPPSSRPLSRKIFRLQGAGGMTCLLTSPRGLGQCSRVSFLHYLSHCHPSGLGRIGSLIDCLLRIQTTDHPEILRHLAQQLFQKHISSSLNSTSEAARLFWAVLPASSRPLFTQALEKGHPIDPSLLAPIFPPAILRLSLALPSFLHQPLGSLARELFTIGPFPPLPPRMNFSLVSSQPADLRGGISDPQLSLIANPLLLALFGLDERGVDLEDSEDNSVWGSGLTDLLQNSQSGLGGELADEVVVGSAHLIQRVYRRYRGMCRQSEWNDLVLNLREMKRERLRRRAMRRAREQGGSLSPFTGDDLEPMRSESEDEDEED